MGQGCVQVTGCVEDHSWYCQLDPCEQTSVEFYSKFKHLHSGKAFENVACGTAAILSRPLCVNTWRPRQNGRHFADDLFKCIFLKENIWISIKISLQFVPMGPINNIPILIQIMAWRRQGDKQSSEPALVRLPTHICVTRPQCLNNP